MGTAFQASKAQGTKACGDGRVRHTITLRRKMFDRLRALALANHRSVSEEIVARLDSVAESQP